MLSFTHPLMLFQTCMTFFLLWNIIEDILKNVFVHTNQWTPKAWLPVLFKTSFMSHRRMKVILVWNAMSDDVT